MDVEKSSFNPQDEIGEFSRTIDGVPYRLSVQKCLLGDETRYCIETIIGEKRHRSLLASEAMARILIKEFYQKARLALPDEDPPLDEIDWEDEDVESAKSKFPLNKFSLIIGAVVVAALALLVILVRLFT
ncbi:hypothetical protein IKF15_03285 [Candidatus Saccharibacteria bacterium]|nr:hypothetical protein [Candidatus Saccharibacteria bacterium]